jgi:hypothetical protein
MEGTQQPEQVLKTIARPADLRELVVGDKFMMNGSEFEVLEIGDGAELGAQFDLKIDRHVPVYYLKGYSAKAQGGYQPEADVVVMFENNTDPTTLEHELRHAVEWKFEPTPGLLALYEKAKVAITEDSFDGNFFTFNFMKNIHEFLADGGTKLKSALQKEGLYEDFQRKTAYIFE